MHVLVWLLLAALVVLHQVDPFRADATVVGGVLPITLVYHVVLSLAAGFVWYLATRYAWPLDDEPTTSEASEESTP